MRIRIPIIIIVFLLTVVLLVWGWTDLGVWLDKADPLQNAEVIICLSGKGREKKAAELYLQGRAPKIILTVARDKRVLIELGVPENRITLAPGPKTTFQEALAVAPLLQQAGVRTALVVSDPYHLRRVRWTFNHVLSRMPVRLSFVATDMPWNGKKWWQEKIEKRYVYSEVPKIGWYWLAHGLLGIKDDPPWAVRLKQRYERWLNNHFSGKA